MTQARDKANIPVLNFASKGIDDNADATAITIDSGEDVGIGNTSPFARLVVQGANNENTMVVNTIGTSPNYIFDVRDDGTSVFRINGSGNVGIGTSSPPFLLSLSGNSQGISFTDTSGGTNAKAWLMQGLDSDFRLKTQLDNYGGGQLASIISRSGAVVNTHQFYTEDSERMRLTTTGLGIGTSSPVATLTVGSNSSGGQGVVGKEMLVSQTLNTTYSGGTSGSWGGLMLNNNNSSTSVRTATGLHFTHGTSGVAGIVSTSTTSQRADIRFITRGAGDAVAERVIINDDGKVGIGTTNPSNALTVNGDINSNKLQLASNAGSHTRLLLIKDTGNAGSNRNFIEFHNTSGSTAGRIEHSGSTAVNYVSSSDYRLKENVSYDFDATTRIKQLKPARFNFIEEPNKTVDGFLAHEVSSIVPEAISGEKDELQVWKEGEELSEGVSVGDNKLDADGNTIIQTQGIDQSKLVPLLVKTIQELEARITTLENN